MHRMVVPYDQGISATLLNSRPSTAFTMSIFRRLHEYSRRTGISFRSRVAYRRRQAITGYSIEGALSTSHGTPGSPMVPIAAATAVSTIRCLVLRQYHVGGVPGP